MSIAAPDPQDHTIPGLPRWVTSGAEKTPQDVAFLSGGALAHLDIVLRHASIPLSLLRERLALQAAEVCLGLSGRPERAADLRDAVHLMRPGDLPGPAGEVYLIWQRAVERPVSRPALQRAMPEVDAADMALWWDAGKGAPIARAAAVLEAVLNDTPTAETVALILADAALARAAGWDYLLPVLSIGLRPSDLRKRGKDLQLACCNGARIAVPKICILAADLTRKAARLRSVAPKLRAKQSPRAVEMFLTRDAVAPMALPLPDRAARRLCDRLIDLGVLRELTGRDTFRIYGL